VPRVSREGAKAVIKVDAADGFAFPAIAAGLAAAEAAVKATGIVAVSVTRSHHCGVAGHHVERLARKGFVGLMFANTPGAMAVWGGRRPLLGTNPIAFAAPNGEAPLVVDLSLSKVARGKLLVAKQKGERIAEGIALDPEGRPTMDPEEGLKGSLLPLGDAKGAALALMVEILAASLTGSNHAFEASSFLDSRGGPPRVGQLILAFDPAAFSDDFTGRLGVLLGAIGAEQGARLPGARRYALRKKHRAEGLDLPADLLRAIRARVA
jgi:(2R)-3-sulfolactate dehydrogenase (NADP+)